MVVYSVVDRRTFKVAEQILHYLRDSEMLLTRGAILVGNKTDLERHREVTRQGEHNFELLIQIEAYFITTPIQPNTAGRHLAKEVACKFIETSSGLDHNVNELLVGIVAQVKLNPQRIRNLSDKQKLQLAAATAVTSVANAKAVAVSQQKQQRRAAAAAALAERKNSGDQQQQRQQRKVRKSSANDNDDDDDDGNEEDGENDEYDDDDYGEQNDSYSGDSSSPATGFASVVRSHPLPRTERENHLFKDGGRPYGQRVVLSIKQQLKQRTATNANQSPTASSKSGSVDGNESGDNAENTSPSSQQRQRQMMAHGSGGAMASTTATTSPQRLCSPASRISLRTKYLLTSFLKFKRTLRVKRRSSSSCSDLFAI